MTADPFRDAGSLRPLYDAVDWASGPLGPVAGWSPTLRGAVDLMLNTRFPITLLWGPQFVLVYNEAYVELIADKHPAALGRPCADVFPEAWDVIGPMMESVAAGEGATWVEDTHLPLRRGGRLEECYFTFSYSPVHDPGGDVEGVIDVTAETTGQVVLARRLHLLTRLAEALADVEDLEALRWEALAVLSAGLADLPEVDLRVWEAVGREDEGAGTPTPELVPDDDGFVRLPVRGGRRSSFVGLLVARVSPALPFDSSYREFLFMVATGVSRALDRIGIVAAERSLSTALQSSLLTEPVELDRASLAVRYLPASDVAQVGGDWYDAFTVPGVGLTLVVGDVAGHDQDSAAAMGQLRNLLRGIAFASRDLPAAVLSGLDQTMAGLEIDAIATALVARCRMLPDGGLAVTWANAGHPPPVLLGRDGRARLLHDGSDLLLGLDPATRRVDHEVVLGPGEHLVLFTDGLVERRDEPLDLSLAALVDRVAGHQHDTAHELCDHILDGIGRQLDDDVALVVVRADPAHDPVGARPR